MSKYGQRKCMECRHYLTPDNFIMCNLCLIDLNRTDNERDKNNTLL